MPRWAGGYAVPIVSGTSEEQLRTGVLGHYAFTQAIGAVGNAGMTGHRTTRGKPLREAHHLEQDDAVVVEGDTACWAYRVSARRIVEPGRSEDLDPVPPFAGATQGRNLTLKTCDSIFGNSERYIVGATAD